MTCKVHSALLISLYIELQMQSQASHPLQVLAAFDKVWMPSFVISKTTAITKQPFSLTSWCLTFINVGPLEKQGL